MHGAWPCPETLALISVAALYIAKKLYLPFRWHPSMEKSCGAAIYRLCEGKRLYLLLHYEEGHWDFPKGHVEAGENEKETALREIMEETGITELEFVPDFRELIAYSFWRGNMRVPKEVVFFLAKTNAETVTLSHEHQGYAWLEYADAMKKATYKNAKLLLEKAELRLLLPS
jgi:bis(5'-nucleosidyl)-tetraphosphatase